MTVDALTVTVRQACEEAREAYLFELNDMNTRESIAAATRQKLDLLVQQRVILDHTVDVRQDPNNENDVLFRVDVVTPSNFVRRFEGVIQRRGVKLEDIA